MSDSKSGPVPSGLSAIVEEIERATQRRTLTKAQLLALIDQAVALAHADRELHGFLCDLRRLVVAELDMETPPRPLHRIRS